MLTPPPRSRLIANARQLDVQAFVLAYIERLLECQLADAAFERRPRLSCGESCCDARSLIFAAARCDASQLRERVFEAPITEARVVTASDRHGSI